MEKDQKEAWSGPSQTQRSQAAWPESARQPPKLACPAMLALPRGTADLYLDKGTHMILTCALSPLYYPQLLNCQWRKRRWHSLLKYKMPKKPLPKVQSKAQKPMSRLQPGQNEKQVLYILYLTPQRPLTSWSKAAQRPVCVCPPTQWARKM